MIKRATVTIACIWYSRYYTAQPVLVFDTVTSLPGLVVFVVVNLYFHCPPPPFFHGLILFKMGMLNSLDTIFKFSHITEVSFPEFVIDNHYYTSPNQQEEPPTISFKDSESPTTWTILALHNHPYLSFMLFSPFHGAMTSRLSTPPEQIPLDKDGHASGYRLEVLENSGIILPSDHHCPSCFIWRGTSLQLHPIPPSLATPKVIAPWERLALPYLTLLTLSWFFSPTFPSALQFVGNLTTPGPPLYLQVRRAIGTP